MSQSTCPVCARPDCTAHTDAKIIRFDPALVARLVQAEQTSNVWSRWQVQPGSFGLVPLTIYVSPRHAALDGAFWLKEIETRVGEVHHLSLYLVAVPAASAAKYVFLHESNQQFVKGRHFDGAEEFSDLAVGKSEAGYFAFTYAPYPPPVADSSIRIAVQCNVESLANLDWQPGKAAGVIRQAAIQDASVGKASGRLMVYDHRREATPTADVVVTEKLAGGIGISLRGGMAFGRLAPRQWFHVNLYPPTGDCEGRVALGGFDLRPDDGEVIEWIWHSTSASGSQRMQSAVVFAIFLSAAVWSPGGQEPAAAREAVDELLATSPTPGALLDALEALVLARVATGEIKVSQDSEAQWGRIRVMRDMAERPTTLWTEAMNAIRHATFALSRLAGYPRGHFDSWLSSIEAEMQAAAANQPAPGWGG